MEKWEGGLKAFYKFTEIDLIICKFGNESSLSLSARSFELCKKKNLKIFRLAYKNEFGIILNCWEGGLIK